MEIDDRQNNHGVDADLKEINENPSNVGLANDEVEKSIPNVK